MMNARHTKHTKIGGLLLFAMLALYFMNPAIALKAASPEDALHTKMRWGGETNGLKVGVLIETGSANNGQPSIECNVYVHSNLTNELFNCFLPPETIRYFLIARVETMSPARKLTPQRMYKQLPQDIQVSARRVNEYRRVALIPNQPNWVSVLTLSDHFKLRKADKYRVELELRLVKFIPGPRFERIPLLPVTFALD